MIITVDYVRECLTYCPDSGILIWNVRPISHFKNSHAMNAWNARYAGIEAGSINGDGYKQSRINRKIFRNHTLCWAISHGEFPTFLIDHRDRNRLNNADSNLRECTNADNSHNMNSARANCTGFKGVKKSGRNFTAQICVENKRKHLGSFPSAELAHEAYRIAATLHHGEFANFGD